MIGFTLSTTDNPKRFPKKIRFSVTNKIQGHALAIYDYLVEANEIFPIMDDQDKADRLKLQRAALTECKKLLHMIQLSKDRGYIDSGTFDYWTKLTVDVKSYHLISEIDDLFFNLFREEMEGKPYGEISIRFARWKRRQVGEHKVQRTGDQVDRRHTGHVPGPNGPGDGKDDHPEMLRREGAEQQQQ